MGWVAHLAAWEKIWKSSVHNVETKIMKGPVHSHATCVSIYLITTWVTASYNQCCKYKMMQTSE